MRRMLPLLAFALLIVGCSLGTPPPTAVPTTEPSQAPVFIDARTITPTLAATATIAPTAVLRPNCVIRTDWLGYTVYPGETLGRIAARSGTTASVMAAANCLANPDMIYAGQLLRVPVLLPPPTNLPPPNQVAGVVVPSPYISQSSGQYQVAPDTTIALVWQITPVRTFTRVDFLFAPTGAGSTPSLIGSDTYIADGIAVNFFVPQGLLGYVSAIAYYGSGIVGGTAQSTLIYAQSAPPNPPVISTNILSISPYISLNNATYVVQTGQMITLLWDAVFPAQTRLVDFYLRQPGQVSNTLIGSDFNLADGVQVLYRIPVDIQGTVFAQASFSGGYAPQNSAEYYIVTEAVQ